MKRAFVTLEIKVLDNDSRTFSGIATTPATDLVDDVVEPKGAQFKLPIPLLWQHRHDEPIGHVTEARVTDKGIFVKGKMPKVDEPGRLKDRLDEAWQTMNAGLVGGLSIGFKAVETAQIEGSFGTRFIKWLWLELSAVTIAANSEATITSIKSIDKQLRDAAGVTDPSPQNQFDTNASAATGTIERLSKTLPGASGKSMKPVSLRQKDATNMTTIAEHISALENKRASYVARMDEIAQKSIEEGRSTEEDEGDELDTLKSEMVTIDKDLTRFRDIERFKASTAKPVNKTVVSDDGGEPARSGIIVRKPKLPPGIAFTRIARVKALGRLDGDSFREKARELYGEDSGTYGAFVKTAVAGGSTATGNWAENLVGDETSAFADFAEFLRPQTILGKFGTNGIPSLRSVPFRVALVSQTAGGSGYWVGEGKAKPLTSINTARTTLTPLKVANIAVVTEEVLRDSSPSAEMILRDALVEALRERLDIDFVDPDKTASAGVSPASITNGITPIASSGTDADAIRTDAKALMTAFLNADNPWTSGVWIMAARTALSVSLLRNSLGSADEFPGIGINSGMVTGTFLGLPIIASEHVTTDASPGDYVFLVNAQDIYVADEGGFNVDMSREASLQMDDAPTQDSAAPTATSSVSMFQTNSVAFRAERTINWARRRDSGVQVLANVNWGG